MEIFKRMNKFQDDNNLLLSVEERELLRKYHEYLMNIDSNTLIFDIKVNTLFQASWYSSTKKLADKLNLECDILEVGELNFLFFSIYTYKVIVKGEESKINLFNKSINGGKKL